MKAHGKQSGFTAVELLITLFVAAAFLIAGFQLFNVVIRDGGNARAESRAGNVAYDYLRRYASQTTNPCRAAIPVNGESVDVSGLSNVKMSILISCPPYSTTNLSRIEAVIQYNNPQQTVRYATYATGSQTPSDATLIGWWGLNGRAADQSGYGSMGVLSGPIATTNKDNQRDSAFSFDGTDDYINVGTNSTVGNLTNNFSVSAWIRPQAFTTANVIIAATRAASNNGFSFAVYGTGLRFTTYTVKDYDTAGVTLLANTWYHVTAVLDNNNVTFYVNGVNRGTITHTTGGLANTDDPYQIGASTSNGSSTLTFPFNGKLDDIRIYSRVLSADEITRIYNTGAQ